MSRSRWGEPKDRRVALALLLSATVLTAMLPVGLADADASVAFSDVAGSPHAANIVRIATAGVTKGCNPPINDLYCPDRDVTRAEMATFLVRALRLQQVKNPSPFVDVVGSPHVFNIATIATLGITKGCNPPSNDMFCPNRPVTRGEMATFLVRALKLPRSAVNGHFVDTAPSQHAANIAAIAAAGITKGCNPPLNDRFCPNRPVSRAEMATFLVRAMPELGSPTPTTTTLPGSSSSTSSTSTTTTTPVPSPLFLGTTLIENSDWHVRAIAVGDVTSDGAPDVVALSNGGSLVDDREIRVFEVDPSRDASLTQAVELPPIHSDTITLGDLDDDGRLDVVVSGEQALVYFQGDDGILSTTPVELGSVDNNWVWAGDIDADGDDDLVLASLIDRMGSLSREYEIMTQGPAGDFSSSFRTHDNSNLWVLASEITGDGIHDLIGWGAYHASAGSSWGETVPLGAPLWTSDINAGRLGSGHDPVILVTEERVAARLHVVNVETLESTIYEVLPEPGAVTVADIDDDGLDDVILMHGYYGPDARAGVMRGEASGALGEEVAYSMGFPGSFALSTPTGVEAADLDGDGRLDLAGFVDGAGMFSILWGADPGA